MNLVFAPTWIVGRIEVYVELFPINHAVGQRTGSHDMDDERSMSPQSLIERFQMPLPEAFLAPLLLCSLMGHCAVPPIIRCIHKNAGRSATAPFECCMRRVSAIVETASYVCSVKKAVLV